MAPDLIKLINQGPAYNLLPSTMEKILESNSINTRLNTETKFTALNNEAKNEASKYLERPISDIEWNQLVAATFAEASSDQTERAYVMAAVLNRARRDRQTITNILYAKNQFQAVTGPDGKSGTTDNPHSANAKKVIPGITMLFTRIDCPIFKLAISKVMASGIAEGNPIQDKFLKTCINRPPANTPRAEPTKRTGNFTLTGFVSLNS